MHLVYNPFFDDFAGDEFVSLSKPSAFYSQLVREPGSLYLWVDNFLPDDELFYAVHSKKYIDAVRRGITPNGYGNDDDRFTAHAERMCGAMVEAARLALATGLPACAPVQGFHHAHWDSNYGYCTFNGLLMAAADLRRSGCDKPIIIIDCDGHRGDGTDDILFRNDHRWLKNVVNVSYERDNYSEEKLRSVIRSSPDSVIFYQAGADSHIGDPYGAGYLTASQMADRDFIVFTEARATNSPVVWNLAGGYQDLDLVLELHMNTANICRDLWAKRTD